MILFDFVPATARAAGSFVAVGWGQGSSPRLFIRGCFISSPLNARDKANEPNGGHVEQKDNHW